MRTPRIEIEYCFRRVGRIQVQREARAHVQRAVGLAVIRPRLRWMNRSTGGTGGSACDAVGQLRSGWRISLRQPWPVTLAL